MNHTKINVDALPCQNSSFRVWFWLMIACVFLSMTLVGFSEVTSTQSNLINIVLPLLYIPGIIYNYIFAKACKNVSENLYKYWLGTIILSLTIEILSAIGGTTESNVVNLISGIILLMSLVLCIKIVRLLVKNYTGLLGDLGKNLSTILILGVFGAVFLAIIIIISLYNNSPGLIIGPAILFIGTIVFYAVKCLCISYRLLNNGLCLPSHNNIPRETTHKEDSITGHSRIVWFAAAIILIASHVIIVTKCSY